MPKGGYKVINMRGVDVISSGVKVEGLYNSIESNNGKPIMLRNFSLSGTEMDAVWAPFRSVGDTFQAPITVNNQGNDQVKLIVNHDDTTYVVLIKSITVQGDPGEQEEPSASM